MPDLHGPSAEFSGLFGSKQVSADPGTSDQKVDEGGVIGTQQDFFDLNALAVAGLRLGKLLLPSAMRPPAGQV